MLLWYLFKVLVRYSVDFPNGIQSTPENLPFAKVPALEINEETQH